MQNTKTRIFKLHRLQKQPRITMLSVHKLFLDTKYMFKNREDSENAFRISVSLKVTAIFQF